MGINKKRGKERKGGKKQDELIWFEGKEKEREKNGRKTKHFIIEWRNEERRFGWAQEAAQGVWIV